MQPTEEQSKKFWEWCGLKQICPPEKDSYKRGMWTDLEGMRIDTPPIDLDNLFKYAVPKVVHYDLQNLPYEYEGQHTAIVYMGEGKYYQADSKDPALALFWALWQVKEA